MRTVRYAVLWLGLILLAACGSPSGSAPSEPTKVLPKGPSAGLKKLAGRPRYNLETIGGTVNPLTQTSVSVPAGEPLTMSGWAVDAQSQTAAAGVDVVIDDVPYSAQYGSSRQDVAEHLKLPAYANSGFELAMPKTAIGKGKHQLSVRVISKDRSSYWEGMSLVVDVQ